MLQLDTATDTFTQIAHDTFSGGPEGVTLVDDTANEFYTVDENNFEIRRYSHAADFSGLALMHSWNLLSAPSPMTYTGNTGPEGIAFVPDRFLAAAGFASAATGQPYASAKGLGGLIFIAHQNGGYVWVFDVNPDVTDDFEFVGKYQTNRTESCDLAFDRSTGLLYILHNASQNTLEVTDLTTDSVGGEWKFTMLNEHAIPNPAGNINIEGFAITPKCVDTTNVSAWLCRDVESGEILYRFDCIRWFQPFLSDGVCENNPSTLAPSLSPREISVSYNFLSDRLFIHSDEVILTYVICNSLGGIVRKAPVFESDIGINMRYYQNGIYFVLVQSPSGYSSHKFVVTE